MAVRDNPNIPRERAARHLLVGFVAILALFQGLTKVVVPRARVLFEPPADSTPQASFENDPELDSILSGLPVSSKPQIIVLHTSCPSCSEQAHEHIKVCLAEKGVLNLIESSQRNAYIELLKTAPQARVMYASEALVSKLNPVMSPRVYGLDKTGRLAYIQLGREGNIAAAILACKAKLGIK